MPHWKIIGNIIGIFFIQGTFCQNIYLTPNKANIDINGTFTFTCVYTGYDEVKGTKWNIGELYSPTIMRNQYGTCTGGGIFSNDADYKVGCSSKTSFTVTILRIKLEDHNITWECLDLNRKSNSVTVFVKVPVTKVILSVIAENSSFMKEHSRQTIKCTTSYSRPQPQVNWYIQDFNNRVKVNVSGNSSTESLSSNAGLQAAKSTLLLYPNRTINNWMLFCEGWSDNTTHGVQSNNFIMNVTYPPDSPPSILGFESGETYRLIELEVGKLSCSIFGGNPLPRLLWKCYNKKATVESIDGKSVITNVTWIGSRDQTSCSCISNHSWTETTQSKVIQIDVQYPPQKPKFKITTTEVADVINVILNNTIHITCESKGNPNPNYTWSGPALSDRNVQVLKLTKYHTNMTTYTCTATNHMVRQNTTFKDGHSVSSIKVKVLYPPGKPKFTYVYANGSNVRFHKKVDAVKGDSMTVLCNAGGNPPPIIHWEGYKGNTLNITSVMSDSNNTCIVKYVMKETVGETRGGNTSASFSINVLYPPGFPNITVSNGSKTMKIKNTVQIKEMDDINMTCHSNANPIPTYTWKQNNSRIPSEVRQFRNISRNDAGNYVCIVNNLMIRTFGEARNGSNSSSIFMDVMYPSVIQPLKDESILEGSDLSIVCKVQPGKLSEESITWTRKSDSRDWKSHNLTITNVSRTDDTDCTCTLISRLIPTIGKESVIVSNRTIHLNVFFPSEIKTFSIKGIKSKETFIINTNRPVTLECKAEANPTSDLSIRHFGTSISTVKGDNSLLHKIANASFENAGIYICEGRNNFTKNKPSISSLILIVKSQPRPSNNSKFASKIAASLYSDKTLQFAAHKYLDEENKTTFTWFKQNMQISDKKFEISTIGLSSNLSVRNITKSDFGEYSIKVINSVGDYIHFYELQAADKPDVPANFSYLSDFVTDMSVLLSWTPGFNGGFPQTFILLYQVSQGKKWQSVSVKDIAKETMNYTLTGLLSSTVYNIKMFAENKLGNSSVTQVLQLKTKPKTEAKDKMETNNVAAIAGSVSSVVVVGIIVSIIFAVIFFRKRRKGGDSDRLYQNVPFIGTTVSKKHMKNNNTKYEKETTFQDLQEVDDMPHTVSENTEYTNNLEIIEQIDRIQIPELFAYVFGRKERLEAEYQKLPAGLQKPCTFARKPENIALNRYNGIYPYDHSRVKVHGDDGFFINACYIDGYKCSRQYIASLGPTSKTTDDFKTFWKVVWNEKSDLIVMLTNLNEKSGMKCEQYWPNEGSRAQYGQIIVTSKGTDVFAEYTQRKFTVSMGAFHRSLTHLHYTAWPDKTVPEDVSTLLGFRQIMRSVTSEGPVIIHCSAGIGRTGTLIAIDRLIEEGINKGSVNVFECVQQMREQRVKMVQTQEQYVYIHKALVMALTLKSEALTIEKFHDYISTAKANMYSKLFQELQQTIETDSEAEEKARYKNKERLVKNRSGADIPGNKFNVLLHICREEEESDYINAVYINSFKQKDHFVAAQSPLPSTVIDFLAMIYQEDCSCIVTMEDVNSLGKAVGEYLPGERKTLTAGKFEVVCSRLESKQSYVIRKMKIKYSGKFETGEKSIIHFQYRKWPAENDTPGDVSEFVKFANEVEEYAYELGEERSRVIVHCLKANERSCLFCAVVILMEKIKYERQVNVLENLRHLRTRRQSAITSQKQLEFCYDAVNAFINMYMKSY